MEDKEVFLKLKKERERRGLSLKEISRATLIKTRDLEGIENFSFSEFDAYQRSYIRIYAAYLGFDPKEFIEVYNTKFSTPPIYEIKHHKKPIKTIFFSLFLVAFLGSMFFISYKYFFKNSTKTNSDIIIPNESIKEGEKIKKEEGAGTKKETQEKQEEKLNLKLVALERSWISVLVDGIKIFEGTLFPKEEKVFEGKKIFIKFGNAKGTKILINGKDFGLVSETEYVLEKEFLSGEY